mmetsp:Transcript_36645/g.105580  ORF Transcript_36645/g.105580 Transcript_36645/m.105580 type:complete len:225 (+) Transcript_36645:2360-3034(+)
MPRWSSTPVRAALAALGATQEGRKGEGLLLLGSAHTSFARASALCLLTAVADGVDLIAWFARALTTARHVVTAVRLLRTLAFAPGQETPRGARGHRRGRGTVTASRRCCDRTTGVCANFLCILTLSCALVPLRGRVRLLLAQGHHRRGRARPALGAARALVLESTSPADQAEEAEAAPVSRSVGCEELGHKVLALVEGIRREAIIAHLCRDSRSSNRSACGTGW